MSALVTLTGLNGNAIVATLLVECVPRVGETVSYLDKNRQDVSFEVSKIAHQVRNNTHTADTRIFVHLDEDDERLNMLGFYRA